jgi:hypothetical protein
VTRREDRRDHPKGQVGSERRTVPMRELDVLGFRH